MPPSLPASRFVDEPGLVREHVVVDVHRRADRVQPGVVAAADVGERLAAVGRLPDVDRVEEERVGVVRVDGEAHVVPHLRRVLTARAGGRRAAEEVHRRRGRRPASSVVPPFDVRHSPRKQPRAVVAPRAGARRSSPADRPSAPRRRGRSGRSARSPSRSARACSRSRAQTSTCRRRAAGRSRRRPRCRRASRSSARSSTWLRDSRSPGSTPSL